MAPKPKHQMLHYCTSWSALGMLMVPIYVAMLMVYAGNGLIHAHEAVQAQGSCAWLSRANNGEQSHGELARLLLEPPL